MISRENFIKFIWLVPVLFFVFLLFANIPAWLIDIIIVAVFTGSIVILLQASTTKDWSELSTLPIILIVTAIFRVSLNIATTKKILYDGNAGTVIDSVAHLVVGDNMWLGFVIFIVIVILGIAITIGANRMGEVNARFILDQLPVKQMDITTDLNSGLIKPEEAKQRKLELSMQSEFYSSMDGAGKYIKSDVIITIVLFVINISVGFIVGMMEQGLSASESITRYTMLTVGDGVINAVASLMIAIGTGLVLGRVYDRQTDNIIKKIVIELTRNTIALYVAGGVALVLPLAAGFSGQAFVAFWLIGISLIVIAYQLERKRKKEIMTLNEQQEEIFEEQERQNQLRVAGEVEPIKLELGYTVAKLVLEEDKKNTKKGSQDTLTERIRLIRRNIMFENGIEIPEVRIVDDATLARTQYRIKIKDIVVGQGTLQLDKVLALQGDLMFGDEELINGEQTIDPVFGTEAYWIPKEDANSASLDGWTIEDWMGIVSTHMRESILAKLHIFIDRQQTQDLIEQVSERHPVIKKEIETEKISLSIIQGVFKNLVKENISIKDLPVILENVIDAHHQIQHQIQMNMQYTNEPMDIHLVDEISQWVREAMAKNICERFKVVDELNPNGVIHGIMYDMGTEKSLSKVSKNDGYYLNMEPLYKESVIHAMLKEVERVLLHAKVKPVVITRRSDIRSALARAFQEKKVHVTALSFEEITKSGVDLNVAKMVDSDQVNKIQQEFEKQY